ncbi:hypothetical protein RvY_11070 [Ramazzottius varieornatus]|uniref:Uncharacterized protein n=1 Tax=Ramazzottius varieornatus TaxID=947166 RepID=A0A1D1VHC1_RAMVA|nr:hypothetical protein RvY_11070 [Ramazzottius varieornatus]
MDDGLANELTYSPWTRPQRQPASTTKSRHSAHSPLPTDRQCCRSITSRCFHRQPVTLLQRPLFDSTPSWRSWEESGKIGSGGQCRVREIWQYGHNSSSHPVPKEGDYRMSQCSDASCWTAKGS